MVHFENNISIGVLDYLEQKARFTLGVRADVQPKSSIPIGAKVEISSALNVFTLSNLQNFQL
jgi:predicted thioesterase